MADGPDYTRNPGSLNPYVPEPSYNPPASEPRPGQFADQGKSASAGAAPNNPFAGMFNKPAPAPSQVQAPVQPPSQVPPQSLAAEKPESVRKDPLSGVTPEVQRQETIRRENERYSDDLRKYNRMRLGYETALLQDRIIARNNEIAAERAESQRAFAERQAQWNRYSSTAGNKLLYGSFENFLKEQSSGSGGQAGGPSGGRGRGIQIRIPDRAPDYRKMHSDQRNPGKATEHKITSTFSNGRLLTTSNRISQPTIRDLVNGEDSAAIQAHRANDAYANDLRKLRDSVASGSFYDPTTYQFMYGMRAGAARDAHVAGANAALEAYIKYGDQKGLDRYKAVNKRPDRFDRSTSPFNAPRLQSAFDVANTDAWNARRKYQIGPKSFAFSTGERATQIFGGLGSSVTFIRG